MQPLNIFLGWDVQPVWPFFWGVVLHRGRFEDEFIPRSMGGKSWKVSENSPNTPWNWRLEVVRRGTPGDYGDFELSFSGWWLSQTFEHIFVTKWESSLSFGVVLWWAKIRLGWHILILKGKSVAIQHLLQSISRSVKLNILPNYEWTKQQTCELNWPTTLGKKAHKYRDEIWTAGCWVAQVMGPNEPPASKHHPLGQGRPHWRALQDRWHLPSHPGSDGHLHQIVCWLVNPSDPITLPDDDLKVIGFMG